MNVLYTIQTHGPGGAEAHLVNLARSFNNEKSRSFGFFITKGWLVDEFQKYSIPLRICESNRLFDFPLLINLLQYVRHNKITIMHAHEFYMAFYCALVSKMTGIPSITTYHGKSPYSLQKWMRYRAFKFSLTASTPVSVSYDLRQWIAENYRIPPQSLHVIQNGIDDTEFKKLDRKVCRKRILRIARIPDNAVIVTTVARLFPVKGVDHLVRAAARILGNNEDVHFVVAGNGPEKPRLEAMISEAHIGDRFHLLGECNYVPELLSASDLFVLPSNSEELSISILEAMFSRLPLIVTDVGDNNYLVHQEKDGFIVQKGRADLMAEKIAYMLAHREMWSDMGRQGLEIARSQFSNATMLDKYRELYENVQKK